MSKRPVVILNGFATRTGGAVTRLEQLARRMPDALGVEVVAIAPRESSLTLDGMSSHLVLVPRVAEKLPGYLRKSFEPRVISLIVRRTGARVVLHFGSYVPIASTGGIRNILCFTNMEPWGTGRSSESIRNRLLQRLFEMTHARADAIVVQSESTREWLAERYPVLKSRLHVVRNGCAIPAMQRPAETCGFVALGDVHRYRRLDTVISAYLRLPEAVRSQHPLMIAGSLVHDRRAAANVLGAANQPSTANGIHSLGKLPRSRVLELLAASTAFVSFSAVENGPNSVCEAERIGARMILSDIPAHREYGGSSGHYVQDENELHEALLCTAAAAQLGSLPRFIPASDTWQDAIRELGVIVEQVTRR